MALTVTSAAAVASSTSTSATSASFTPAVGEWLVVAVAGGATTATAVTFTISDSQGGTWTLRKLANATSPGGAGGGGATAVWTRTVASATSMTVTVTTSGGTVNGSGLQVWRVSSTAGIAVGASGSGAGSTASITPTVLTSTVSGSTLIVAGSEWSGTFTVTSSDLTLTSFSNANMEGAFGRKTLGSPGSQTANLNAAGSGGLWYWVAVELYAATTGDATQTVTATATGTGVRGAVGAATQTATASATSTGTLGARGAATSTTTASATGAGVIGARGAATATTTATATATGVVRRAPFPANPLPILVELELGGERVDVTPWTRGVGESPVRITRGRTGEGAQTERSTCTLTLDNRDARFSPRNPSGPWYGLLGRNTPLWVTVTEGGPYLSIGGAGQYAACADSTALHVTGDLDLRVDVDADDWTTGQALTGKGDAGSGTLSWALLVSAGYPILAWSPDGSAAYEAIATAPVPVGSTGRMAVRATLDVDNGAGGWTAQFWRAATADGPWRPVGAPVTAAGTTSVHASTAALLVGDSVAGAPPVTGRYYSVEVRSGIDGTPVAGLDFRDQPTDATTLYDEHGNTWTVGGGAGLSAVHARFAGEVPSWPQAWDPSGRDATVTVQAAGVLRRLGQGASPLASTLRRALLALTPPPVAYWPCEDGEHATSIGSALDAPGMSVDTTDGLTKGRFSANHDFPASADLPTCEESVWTGPVPAYTPTGQTQLRLLVSVQTSGTPPLDGAVIARMVCTGSVPRWDLAYRTTAAGGLQLIGYSASGTAVVTSLIMTSSLVGRPSRVSVGLTETGGGVAWELVSLEAGAATGWVLHGTVASSTVGTVTTVEINSGRQLGGTTVGHVSLETAVSSIFDVAVQLDGYRGENAGPRLQRLCAEAGIPFEWVGQLDATSSMGYQRPKTLLDLLRECVATDGGILYEPRDGLGLGYRTRTSLYRQAPAVDLSYPGHQLRDLRPVEDDLSTRNDVTVTRDGGASARATLDTGPLSTRPVPDGIGRYDQATTMSLAEDWQASPHAWWLLHVGTVDEARYPTLTVELASPHLAGSPRLVHDVLTTDIGDRLVVSDPPVWVPPEQITQLVQGTSEQLGQFRHTVTVNLAPESPYRVGIFDEPGSRYDTAGSELATDVTATATSWQVATTAGPVWSAADGPFDVVVGGERVTVTAVTGTTSPQTLTVVRSANGVVKGHAAGTAVGLAEPVWYGL